MILDATAGNRSIYQYKNSENIIFIDMEKQLWTKPTMFADSRKLPFNNDVFHTIIFDPPHDWGGDQFNFKEGEWLKTRQWCKSKPFQSTYYGWDKYKHKAEIIKYIYESQKEFARVAKDTGLLLIKWCEVRRSIKRLLTTLTEWRLLIEIPTHDPNHTFGQAQTYWLIMEKRKEKEQTITAYSQSEPTKQADTSSATSETLLPFVQEPQAPQQQPPP
jgi:hypothetical protein